MVTFRKLSVETQKELSAGSMTTAAFKQNEKVNRCTATRLGNNAGHTSVDICFGDANS